MTVLKSDRGSLRAPWVASLAGNGAYGRWAGNSGEFRDVDDGYATSVEFQAKRRAAPWRQALECAAEMACTAGVRGRRRRSSCAKCRSCSECVPNSED